MKRLAIMFVAVSMVSLSMAQAEIQFVGEAIEDATFLGNGMDPCYTLTYGEVVFDSDVQSLTAAQLKDMLSQDYRVTADANCPAAGDIRSIAMTIEYADGSKLDYPAEQMGYLKTTPAAERLLHNATKVKLTNISFEDADGKLVQLEDLLITIEG